MRITRWFLALLVLTTGSSAFAANKAIGTDVVRILDENQVVGEAFNLFYQHGLARNSAVVVSVARDADKDMMLEGAFKAYSGAAFSSVYYQVGGNLFDYDDDSELGIHAAIGYERSPARNFVFFGTVKVIIMPDSDYTQFSPMLGAMFAF
ncbi:hypothetical protein [Gynuella sunshinyii]|uniref:Uncharacterized protein n=1 Tax=Gynuella sunshinyii YC6258 TaxID=1445510 RepID=A0A0C5V9X1_9GAMM|nr:hypothetical protein [Gynuella sunshinyii]AJQ96150.1 hypothetical Protein YC6258_04114 [Gynuella sunshinyii YC6258]